MRKFFWVIRVHVNVSRREVFSQRGWGLVGRLLGFWNSFVCSWSVFDTLLGTVVKVLKAAFPLNTAFMAQVMLMPKYG